MTVPAGEALTVVVRCTGPVAERGTIYVLPTAASDGVLEHGRDHVEAKVTALLRRAHEDAEARAAEVDDDQVVHPLRAARDR
ncbi:hypothetical protein [Euzebya sp.]|uniref:hypothetical protein n=1 Tax=Euzebya sp. TaxID=1971409 RepID=UPI003518CE65